MAAGRESQSVLRVWPLVGQSQSRKRMHTQAHVNTTNQWAITETERSKATRRLRVNMGGVESKE